MQGGAWPCGTVVVMADGSTICMRRSHVVAGGGMRCEQGLLIFQNVLENASRSSSGFLVFV